MAFESGTSTSETTSSGLGVGMAGGKLGLGIGGGTTRATSMSLTAQKVAPPQLQKLTWASGLAVIGVLVILNGMTSMSLGTILTGIVIFSPGAYLLYSRKKWNKEVYPQLLTQWQKSWLCHKCGNVFVLE
jgi:hypothetical protein